MIPTSQKLNSRLDSNIIRDLISQPINYFQLADEYVSLQKKFVKETGVNLLAISMGNFHGIEISGIDPNLRIDVLEAVKQKVKDAMIVLHGGSGTPEDDIKDAIQRGIVKININTELRLAFSGNLRRALCGGTEVIVPYKYLPDAQRSVEGVVERKIALFGSGNKI